MRCEAGCGRRARVWITRADETIKVCKKCRDYLTDFANWKVKP
jgi:hypothetical protein